MLWLVEHGSLCTMHSLHLFKFSKERTSKREWTVAYDLTFLLPSKLWTEGVLLNFEQEQQIICQVQDGAQNTSEMHAS